MKLEGKIIQRAELYFVQNDKARHIKHWPDYERLCIEKYGHVLEYHERTFREKGEFPLEGEDINEYPEKPTFPCPYCEKVFRTQKELDNHIETEHTFPCPYCPAVFRTQKELDDHIKKEHSPKLETPLLGDYYCQGVRNGMTGRTIIPLLIQRLKEMGARDFFHQVWKYTYQWDDFKLLAPECQKAGIRLWLYNTPPSEPPSPKPFEYDWVRWAEEVAKLMVKYPVIQGMLMDDFNGNYNHFTIPKCQQFINAARAIAPNFKFIPVAYMGHGSIYGLESHMEAGVFDAMLLVYWWPWKNPTKTDELRSQIEEYRAWIDSHNPNRKISFIPFIVAWRGGGRKEPTPAYVNECLRICKKAYKDGLIEGMATYCLPKDNPEFIGAVTSVYKEV